MHSNYYYRRVSERLALVLNNLHIISFFVKIEKVLESLRLDDDKLRQIMQLLEQEMDAGLSPATHKSADVKMFPTYVRNIANGTETGQVLALDLGGTNFRVLLVTLLPQSKVELTSKIFVIPQSIMLGEGVNVNRKI
jgi:hexokinase